MWGRLHNNCIYSHELATLKTCETSLAVTLLVASAVASAAARAQLKAGIKAPTSDKLRRPRRSAGHGARLAIALGGCSAQMPVGGARGPKLLDVASRWLQRPAACWLPAGCARRACRLCQERQPLVAGEPDLKRLP